MIPLHFNAKGILDASLQKARRRWDRASQLTAMVTGPVAASLSALNNLAVDPQRISRITSASSNHGVAASDLLDKLPGELEHCGTVAVDAFLRGGDALGKHWSHRQSQSQAPQLAAEASNGLWEDGTRNIARGPRTMTWLERLQASADNHLDGILAAAQTPGFWRRTLGNGLEASVYAAALAAVDQLLTQRDALINGSADERRERLLHILRNSGLLAAGALPVSVVLALALMVVPGLAVVMAPLGIIGFAGLGLRLIHAAVNHPSRQEQQALQQLHTLLRSRLETTEPVRITPVTILLQDLNDGSLDAPQRLNN
ncbi:MAG: hypothetical protein VKP70_09360 [Cyanobacteriota bacterium]|nr:hypothetical protein [Cyanobacteriota bacterium]